MKAPTTDQRYPMPDIVAQERLPILHLPKESAKSIQSVDYAQRF